jgi:hypothetical protein
LTWEPEPVLIVRDVRAAYASLRRKSYGFNGLTAEEPPLRLRFRRFLLDWQLFRERDWPVVAYEDVIRDPVRTLRQACRLLRLPYDPAMVSWPKQSADVAYVLPGANATFARSVGAGSLPEAIQRAGSPGSLAGIPRSELRWLEETFAAYNETYGYPSHVEAASEDTADVPRYRGTSRQHGHAELERLRDQLIVKLDVEPIVPAGATFILAGKKNDRTYDGDRRSVPLRTDNGDFGRECDVRDPVTEVEQLRAAGAEFIVFPERTREWLERATPLREHLRTTAECVADTPRSLVFRFRGGAR